MLWNPNSTQSSGLTAVNRTFTLSSDISAIQIFLNDESGLRLGPVSKLPRGAKLEACGTGFNKATMKVAYEGMCYFVFRQDLGIAEPASGMMAAIA